MKRITPRAEVWDRYVRSCAPLVRDIVGQLRAKAATRRRKDSNTEDFAAKMELEIADLIEREYLKE